MARKKNEPTAAAYNSAFPRTLRALMENRVPSVTQSELGKAIGKTRQAVGYYSDGSSSPDWDTLVKIADFFNVSVDYLLGRTEAMSTDCNLRSAMEYTGLSEPAAAKLGTLAKLKNYSVPTVGTVYELNLPALLSAIVTHKKFLPFLLSCGLYKALAKAYDTRQEYAFDAALDAWSGCYDDLNQTVSDRTNGLYCVAPIRGLVDQHRFEAQTQINRIIDSLAGREEE